MRRTLTVQTLIREAAKFAEAESAHDEPLLYGVTDGKAVGTYLEQKFVNYLKLKYLFAQGNAASGVDFPALGVDIKVTSIKQPQSSSFQIGKTENLRAGLSPSRIRLRQDR